MCSDSADPAANANHTHPLSPRLGLRDPHLTRPLTRGRVCQPLRALIHNAGCLSPERRAGAHVDRDSFSWKPQTFARRQMRTYATIKRPPPPFTKKGKSNFSSPHDDFL